MTGRWELRFDGLPEADNVRRRWHWARRAAHDKAWRTEAALKAQAARIPGLYRVRLSAVIYRPRLGVADPRNDQARLKVIEDGLVDAGIVPNDTYRYVEVGAIREERGAPGVLLVVEALE